MPRLFVLDAMALAYRGHYALIRRPLVNSKGEHTSALYVFANTALKIRREEQPDFWALAWDGAGPTERHVRYPEYKAHRKPMPNELLPQIPLIEDLAQAIGLPVLEIPGLEADDVMGTLARRGADEGLDVVLVTGDKDMVQLIGPRVRVLNPGLRGEDYSWVDADRVREKWGVPPEQVRDVLALMGDTSDNIPGVPGVGERTAAELIGKFGSLEQLYERSERGAARIAAREARRESRAGVPVAGSGHRADEQPARRDVGGPARRTHSPRRAHRPREALRARATAEARERSRRLGSRGRSRRARARDGAARRYVGVGSHRDRDRAAAPEPTPEPGG
jgi:5'-3' exonuclease